MSVCRSPRVKAEFARRSPSIIQELQLLLFFFLFVPESSPFSVASIGSVCVCVCVCACAYKLGALGRVCV